MDELKISVIVPVYNLESYVSRCLSSILSQTYYNLEIIVVDDGSIDGSRDVIERYANQDCRVFPIYKENGGVVSARLTGIQNATGDYIGFVDGDDEIEADMYTLLMHNALEYNADISHCGYQMVFSSGMIHQFHGTGRLVEQDRLKGLRDLLEGDFVEPGLCNKLYQRSLFDRLLDGNLTDTSIQINEDLWMNYCLFKESSCSIFADECKYHYIVRKGSASRANLNAHKIYDPIKVKTCILKDVPPEMRETAQKAYLNTCIQTYNSLIICQDRSFDIDRKKVRNLIKQHKKWICLLSRKQCLSGYLAIYLSSLYHVVYRIYVTSFQNKTYGEFGG